MRTYLQRVAILEVYYVSTGRPLCSDANCCSADFSRLIVLTVYGLSPFIVSFHDLRLVLERGDFGGGKAGVFGNGFHDHAVGLHLTGRLELILFHLFNRRIALCRRRVSSRLFRA